MSTPPRGSCPISEMVMLPVASVTGTHHLPPNGRVPTLCRSACARPRPFHAHSTTRPDIDDCAAACDKVIINGRLIKNITYKTLKERDCHSDLNRVCGDVRHCTVEIPFHLFVEVEGAKDCDICEVEDAIVAGEFDKLICKNEDGTFDKLLERSVSYLQHVPEML